MVMWELDGVRLVGCLSDGCGEVAGGGCDFPEWRRRGGAKVVVRVTNSGRGVGRFSDGGGKSVSSLEGSRNARRCQDRSVLKIG